MCRPKSDTNLMFFKATSVWMVMSRFIRLLHHWSETDVVILGSKRRDSLFVSAIFFPLSLGHYFSGSDRLIWIIMWTTTHKKSDLSKNCKLSTKTCSVNVALETRQLSTFPGCKLMLAVASVSESTSKMEKMGEYFFPLGSLRQIKIC